MSSGKGDTISHLTHILHPYSRSSDSLPLTEPDSINIYDACRRMAARRVDALLLTDSNALLCAILTDNDITTRVIAYEVNIQETHVSKDMTKHPIFVLSDTLAVEALSCCPLRHNFCSMQLSIVDHYNICKRHC
ncbi:hypothetical protein R3W88_019370 [Solanum pinnatisectum]|uniref:CBS domain-containing protein n=1 Tax=Solanum pinnatisectum TaxID=50273 RepID=A0AAV9KJY6_9SOLN|nr:hypothetical protein R3W88_019370 [Solanum pinnatisectum]